MDPNSPQQPKRFFAPMSPIAPLSPAKEKLLDEFYEWEAEAKYRPQHSCSDDDSDDSDDCPIVSTERRGPAPYYPPEPRLPIPRPPHGSSSSQNRATPSSHNRATVEAEKTTLSVEQEMAYFNMLTEITKIDTATMSEAQKKAHDGQIAWLCNKLGIPKP
jgi:hypothetical protein